MYLNTILKTLSLIGSSLAFSNLRTCTDGNCARSNRTIDMMSQTRNTTCQTLNVAKGGSFQIVELDPGCSVTLYGSSTSGMCSSETQATGRVETCYSSSWMYFAIEGCRSPTSTSSTARLASSSTKATSISTSSENGARNDRDARRGGMIAGTVVATISGAALLFTVVLMLMRRGSQPVLPKTYELSNDRALVETVTVEKQMAKELWADHAVAEMGRNSRFEESLRKSIEKTGTGS